MCFVSESDGKRFKLFKSIFCVARSNGSIIFTAYLPVLSHLMDNKTYLRNSTGELIQGWYLYKALLLITVANGNAC